MIKLHVTMYYKSQEPDGFTSTKFEMKKTFELNNLPVVECFIRIYDDAISYLDFKDTVYDSKTGDYYINMSTSEDVQRYYHGNAYEIMSKVIDRYKKFGWNCELIKIGK